MSAKAPVYPTPEQIANKPKPSLPPPPPPLPAGISARMLLELIEELQERIARLERIFKGEP